MPPWPIHEGNRDAWNRTARGGYGAEVEKDVAKLASGGSSLMHQEAELLGDLSGWCNRAVHLQCSHGLDALSLLKLGAGEVIGVDISEEMLVYAKQKSDALQANATWIRCDVLDTPTELDGTADLVYTGRGAICWMTDIAAWAEVVARLLKPGGKFLLFEGHPLDCVWDEDAAGYKLKSGATYFQDGPTAEYGFPYEAAKRSSGGQEVSLTLRVWTVGDTVTALIDAGLRIRQLREYPEPFWDQFKAIPEPELRRLPHTFAVVAVKDA